MLKTLKVLLGINDSLKDELLNILIINASTYLKEYCNLTSLVDGRYDSLIIQMVVEDFNKLGSEGIENKSFGGVLSQNYINGYSDNIIKLLNKSRKIKTL